MSKNQSVHAQFRRQKKLNLMPTKSRFRFCCRDKIESNLQSQMYAERNSSILEEPRHQQVNKLPLLRRDVNFFIELAAQISGTAFLIG
jgi:hypothetical protein